MLNVYKRLGFMVFFIASSTFGTAMAADSPLLWTNNSISLLQGTNFKVTGDEASTLTIEHASGWSFGDLFMFFDVTDFKDNPNDKTGWYGEISPRFSLNKLGLVSLENDSFISDVSISINYERGKNGVEAMLLGGGIDFKIPNFTFVKLNIYARKDTGLGAGFDDAQITLAWNKPFTVGNQKFLIDGFMDYIIGWGPKSANVHFVPQVKWDMGNAFGAKPDKFYFGAEIDYWSNKFGIESTTGFKTNQLAISALLKAHF